MKPSAKPPDPPLWQKWLEPRVVLTAPLLVEFVVGVALAMADVGNAFGVMAGTVGMMLLTALLVLGLANIAKSAFKVKVTADGFEASSDPDEPDGDPGGDPGPSSGPPAPPSYGA